MAGGSPPGVKDREQADEAGAARTGRGVGGILAAVRAWVRGLGDRYRSLGRWPRVGIAWLGIAAVVCIPFMLPYITADSLYWTSILTKIGIATLLALGLNVVVGFAGLLDLGYVAFFAVGAYTFATLTGAARFSVNLSVNPGVLVIPPKWQTYFWLYFFVALAVAVLAGVILGAPTLRLRGDYLAIVTLGFGEIVRITADNLTNFTNGALGVSNIPHPGFEFGSIHFSFALKNEYYYWLLVAVIAAWVFLLRRVNASRIGRAWAAIREDEVAAAAMGVATVRMKLLAFAMGAAVASLGGVIYASQVSFISPDQFQLFSADFGSVTILAMVVVGGMGGMAGPILGAALIVFLPERFRFVGDARFLVFGAALVAVMIFRPQGLIPSRRRAAELTHAEDTTDVGLYDVQHGE